MEKEESQPRKDVIINTGRFGVVVTLPLRWKLDWQVERPTRFWLRFEDTEKIAYLAWNSRRKERGYRDLGDYITKKWIDHEFDRFTEGFGYHITDRTITQKTTLQSLPVVVMNYTLQAHIPNDKGHNALFFYINALGDMWHWGMLFNQGMPPKPLPLESSLQIVLEHIRIVSIF